MFKLKVYKNNEVSFSKPFLVSNTPATSDIVEPTGIRSKLVYVNKPISIYVKNFDKINIINQEGKQIFVNSGEECTFTAKTSGIFRFQVHNNIVLSKEFLVK